MHVLVTGGAGFIGSHLVDHLVEEGHEVTVLDNFNGFYDPAIKHANLATSAAKVTLIEGDICNNELIDSLFAEKHFDCVVHLAASAGVRPSIQNPGLYIETNINGTFQLLEAARNNAVRRFVFASSSSVYGVNKKVPFAEHDTLFRTISPYAATKLAGEQLCSNYAHLFGIEIACLRFFTVYGPRQRPDLAISKFTKRILADEAIQRYGDGSTARDYTYIDDIVSGILATIHLPELDFEIFNLGGDKVVSLNELIAAVEKATGKRAIIEQLPEQPGDVPLTNADISKSQRALGYKPATTIDTGVARFVEWFREERAGA
jgi:UDP-glucuronate 4-epimerase